MKMASASSLLGLVSQLQSMESSFAGILFEAVMKLSSLTDAKVFLMVESPEGRSWAGHPILRHTFLREGLHPREEDVEIELDPNVSAIVRRKRMAESLRQTANETATQHGMDADMENSMYPSASLEEDWDHDPDSYDGYSNRHHDDDDDLNDPLYSPVHDFGKTATNLRRKRRLESRLNQQRQGAAAGGKRGRYPPFGSDDAELSSRQPVPNTTADASAGVATTPLGLTPEALANDRLAESQSNQPLSSETADVNQGAFPPSNEGFEPDGRELAVFGNTASFAPLAENGCKVEDGLPGGAGVVGSDAPMTMTDDVTESDFFDGASLADGFAFDRPKKPKKKKSGDKATSWALVPVMTEEEKCKFSLGTPDVLSDAAYLYPSGRISGKGTRPKAMWKGWRYSFHSESSIRNVMLFNCSHRQQSKCKGQITVQRDTLMVVGQRPHDFDVAPDVEATLQEIDEKELLAGFK